MARFGQHLRRARARQGDSLADVSQAIQVGQSYLEALEGEDFGRLPGGPFNRGFVRAYARHLGLDPEATVDAYARAERSQGLATPDADRDLTNDGHHLVELRTEGDRTALVLDWRAVKRAALLIPLAGVVAVVAWLLLQPSPPSAEAVAVQKNAAAPASGPVVRDQDNRTGSMESGFPEGTPAVDIDAGSAARDSAEPSTPRPQAEMRGAGAGKQESASAAAITRETSPTAAGNLRQTDIPTGAESTALPASALAVTGSGVGAEVVNHTLRGQAEAFPAGSRVWFWTRSVGGTPGDVLLHVWKLDGLEMDTQELTVGGSPWRNASWKTLFPGSEGVWTVEAVDGQGRSLARHSFVCRSGSSAGS